MEKTSHQTKQPGFLKRLLPIVIILVVVFVLLNVMKSMKTEPVRIPDKPVGFLVETAQLKPTDVTVFVASQGTLQAKRQINLTSEITGRVLNMSPAFIAGGMFTKGDVLVQLDPADYQVAVARAEASLASAQASLDLEQAKSDQAKKDWQSFGKTGQPSDLLLNIPQLDGAKAGLKAAQADLQKARRDLQKTAIKAPFTGTVISKSVDLGQYVGMAGLLGVIAGTEVAEVRLPLSNDEVSKLHLMQRSLEDEPLAVSFLNDHNETVASGQIRRMEATKDSRTLMNYAVAEIQDPFVLGLRINGFLQARITGHTHQNVFAIPSAWMMPNDQLAVYTPGGKLAIKQVRVAYKTDDYFYVDQGIDQTDLIITTPIQAPTEGMLLRRADQAAETPAMNEQAAS
ncbi:efflux RND transporter periplasmic adaptor subunit [Marinicella sediminis]|uniref:Efflux RND transporter periplasmic adaptor subunit n=1 Tax=Marinicella sediminis TaxID=1792834 RepID=A0ABV7JEQ0_9GAMM|nr:efflux RND transporter periplasmic adaptor subunit [Marinicella sediminis]